MAIEPIKGFYVHDEVTDTDGVAKVSIEAVQEFEDDIRDETSKWLDDHPEATTTVQDGAITESKLNSSFLQSIKNAYVTPEQFGAVGDGVTDDAVAISNALSSGFPVLCNTNSTYLIGISVVHNKYVGVLIENSNVILDGNGATFKVKTSENGYYNVIGCYLADNVVLKNINVVGDRNDAGSHATSEYGHGISLWGCSNYVVDNCNISECVGDGVVVADISETEGMNPCVNGVIRNAEIYNCKRNGVSIVNAEKCKVFNSFIYDISGAPNGPWACVDVEPNNGNQFAKDIVIDSCRLKNGTGLNSVAFDANNESLEISGIVINCICNAKTYLRLNNNNNKVKLLNSTFEQINFELNEYTDVVVENCVIEKNPSAPGIGITKCGTDSHLHIFDVYMDATGTNTGTTGAAPVYISEIIYNVIMERVTVANGSSVRVVYGASSNVLDGSCSLSIYADKCENQRSASSLGTSAKKEIYILEPKKNASGYIGWNKYYIFEDLTANQNITMHANYLFDGERYIINNDASHNVILGFENCSYIRNGTAGASAITLNPNSRVKVEYDRLLGVVIITG